MINGIVGRPRTGKSYEATRYHIVPTILNDRRLVITNIPINKEYIEKVHGKQYADLVVVVDGQFSEYGKVKPFAHEQDFLKYKDWKNEKGQGALFVIDEVHLCCGSRNARPELLEYYSLHGHYGHDHLILTQNARKIHRDLKDMTEIVWRTTKLSAFGKDETYLQNTHHGFDNLSNSVHQEERRYDPEWFPYYKSHTQSETSVIEATSKQVKAVLNPYKKISLTLIGLGLLVIIFLGVRLFTDDPEKSVKQLMDEQLQKNGKIVLPQNSTDSDTKTPVIQNPKPVKSQQIEEKYTDKDDSKLKLNVNEKVKGELAKMSKNYHPFYKVQLHVSGYSSDTGRNQTYYFSASSNGQELFEITLKDLLLAGYSVQIFGECIVEIVYFEYRDFLTCDVPTMGVSSLASANSNPTQ